MSTPLRISYLALAGALLILSFGCEAAAPASPSPVAFPTLAAPRLLPIAPQPTAVPTAVPPSGADLARVVALLERWGLGNPEAAQGATSRPMSATAAGDYTALALRDAAVLTPTAGVQIEPALLLTTAGGAPRALAYAAGNGRDLLVPTQVVWAEHGPAALVLFSWHVGGRLLEAEPFIVLDSAGTRQGDVLWTLSTAPVPMWAPGGQAFAYLDGSVAGPRIVLAGAGGKARISGPAANLECARCWPDGLWAPGGARWAYATTAALPAPATPSPFGHLTWRLVVLDLAAGTVVFDQTGKDVEEAQVVGWPTAAQVQVVVRRPLIPADQITGQQGQWRDTPSILRLDAQPPSLLPAAP